MKIYADYAATTPVAEEVLRDMLPYFGEMFYNPSSLYMGGRQVKAGIESSRQILSDYLHCLPEELIFTSGGTEADNLALIGVMTALKAGGKTHIITTAIEHHAVGETAMALERQGFELTVLPCDKDGIIQPQSLKQAIKPTTGLVSIMWINNETGAAQPIQELCDIAHEGGALFHTDAVQAMGSIDIDLSHTPVDLLSLSAHKIYGPKGVGALFVRQATPLMACQHGGQQEGHRRGGTENTPAIVGFGSAIKLLECEKADRRKKLADLTAQLREGIANIPNTRINTPQHKAIAGVLNVSFKGVQAEPLMIRLGSAGIFASMGAACNSQSIEPSHVLRAMGVPKDYIGGSLRISLGRGSTQAEVEYILEQLPVILQRVRGE